MLQIRAHHARRAFGPQRIRLAVERGKGIHLLGHHHVGRGARRAREQFGLLEQGRADFVEIIARAQGAKSFFDKAPIGDLCGQNIVRAARRLIFHGHYKKFC